MRRGITLVELVVVIAVVGLLCAIGIPALLRQLDRARVRHATTEIISTLALARTTAVARETYVTTIFDSARSSIFMVTALDTLVTRALGVLYDVELRSNRDSTVYGPNGLGFGAANQSVVVQRGSAVDTVIISRLGRVRH